MSAPPWTVGVCGFGRCGSTMLMGMLAAGGCPPVDSASTLSFETDPSELGQRQESGRAIKLLYFAPPPADAWRFVWLDRDPMEQARSAMKFLTSSGLDLAETRADQWAWTLEADRPLVLGGLRARGPVLVLQYERILAAPRKAAKLLRQVWPDLDVAAAAAVVRDRDPRCMPDMSAEDGVWEDAG